MSADEDKPRRRKLNDEERTLWDRVTAVLTPLPRRVPDQTKTTSSQIRSGEAARAHAVLRTPAPKPAPRVEPLERRHKQRLARGSERIDARIDLHGKTQTEAHAALLKFLRQAQIDGAKFVLVITGKGRPARNGSTERGVLQRQVPLWLQLPEFRVCVTAFEQAHARHGGEGALYLQLRRLRAPK